MIEYKVILSFNTVDRRALSLLKTRIKNLYTVMDTSYRKTALHYGFECAGCRKNCCEERFYHYTLAEHMYLADGIESLETETKREIVSRAEEVLQIYGLHDLKGIVRRVMCPLNFEGLCILYCYRPMICRLHGIPHTVKKPGHPEETGPGCHRFTELSESRKVPLYQFDRTVFYSEMASIEIELRRLIHFKRRYRKTVAGMIVDLSDNPENMAAR